MSTYPLTAAERKAKRARIRADVLARAERDAHAAARSLKCSGWMTIAPAQHTGDEDGCKNDGTTCLCECHDRPDPS